MRLPIAFFLVLNHIWKKILSLHVVIFWWISMYAHMQLVYQRSTYKSHLLSKSPHEESNQRLGTSCRYKVHLTVCLSHSLPAPRKKLDYSIIKLKCSASIWRVQLFNHPIIFCEYYSFHPCNQRSWHLL